MRLVNKVVPLAELDNEVARWCDELRDHSPYAIRFVKHAFNADTDHISGFETMSMAAVRLFWDTDEAKHYKNLSAVRRKAKKETR